VEVYEANRSRSRSRSEGNELSAKDQYSRRERYVDIEDVSLRHHACIHSDTPSISLHSTMDDGWIDGRSTWEYVQSLQQSDRHSDSLHRQTGRIDSIERNHRPRKRSMNTYNQLNTHVVRQGKKTHARHHPSQCDDIDRHRRRIIIDVLLSIDQVSADREEFT
jgi:hypothetical protein